MPAVRFRFLIGMKPAALLEVCGGMAMGTGSKKPPKNLRRVSQLMRELSWTDAATSTTTPTVSPLDVHKTHPESTASSDVFFGGALSSTDDHHHTPDPALGSAVNDMYGLSPIRSSTRLPVVARVRRHDGIPSVWNSVNLSEGGMYVRGTPVLSAGDELDVGLWLPNPKGGIELVCKAQVAWTNDEKHRPCLSLPLGMGMRFVHPDTEQKRVLADYLLQQEHLSRKNHQSQLWRAPDVSEAAADAAPSGASAAVVSAPLLTRTDVHEDAQEYGKDKGTEVSGAEKPAYSKVAQPLQVVERSTVLQEDPRHESEVFDIREVRQNTHFRQEDGLPQNALLTTVMADAGPLVPEDLLERQSAEAANVPLACPPTSPVSGEAPRENLQQRPGSTIGSYRIINMLGSGGMGNVYLAEHTQLARRVALKGLHRRFADNADLVQRFFNEARVVNKIRQENIVEITDFITEGPDKFFVMELLEGENLGELQAREGALPIFRVVHIISQLCDALHAVHAANIVHRDLKPDNIMLIEKNGQPDFVKLLDFGVAKLRDHAHQHSITQTAAGMAFGTAGYMAPEQLLEGKTDHRADIYALGVILYQMVTGVKPFVADTWGQLLIKHVNEAPTKPSEITQPMPEELESLILCCLEKKPRNRPQTAQEVKRRLHMLSSIGEIGKLGHRPAGLERRRNVWLISGIVIIVLLGVGALWLWPADIPLFEPSSAQPTQVEDVSSDGEVSGDQQTAPRATKKSPKRLRKKFRSAHPQLRRRGQ